MSAPTTLLAALERIDELEQQLAAARRHVADLEAMPAIEVLADRLVVKLREDQLLADKGFAGITPPIADVDAEAAIAGAAIFACSPGPAAKAALDRFMASPEIAALDESHFHDRFFGAIFFAGRALHAAGKIPTAALVAKHLEAEGRGHVVNLEPQIAALLDALPVAPRLELAQRVADLARYRRLAHALQDLAAALACEPAARDARRTVEALRALVMPFVARAKADAKTEADAHVRAA